MRPSGGVRREEAADLAARACPVAAYRGGRVLLIVPDATRTAPADVFFRALHARVGEISATHGPTIEPVGYHCRDDFPKQRNRFKDLPWGTLAHPTHVRGIGTFEDGVERCRARVTLATGIPRDVCERIHLGCRAPATIPPGGLRAPRGRGRAARPQGGRNALPMARTGRAGQRIS